MEDETKTRNTRKAWEEKESGFDRSNPMDTILIAPLMMLATQVTAVG